MFTQIKSEPIKALKYLTIILMAQLAFACGEKAQDNMPENKVAATAVEAPVAKPILQVYKNPSCGCCVKWVDHMEEAGFEVSTQDFQDRDGFKAEKGIAQPYQSCHTGVATDGSVFEGHVPAKFIKKYLSNRPEGTIGLSVPAMPVGTPGMEVEDKFMPYQVLLLKDDGSVETYAVVRTQAEQY